MTITNEPFGTSPDGNAATLWTIDDPQGLSLSVTDWGATLVSLLQPDSQGQRADVALGFDDASSYIPKRGYLGATCGRFANRIAKGRFTLEGRSYELACNDGENHLHGGDKGFDSKLWKAEPFTEGDSAGVIFRYVSPAGEEGYPGRLETTVTYALSASGRLAIDFTAVTDETTLINMTNHAYWNLDGAGSPSILNHELTLYADQYLPVDEGAIPLGNPVAVADGPFDFRTAKAVGRDLEAVPEGYDHCYAVNGENGRLRKAATLRSPASGREFTLSTDRPGVQLYIGTYLTGEKGKNGAVYPSRSGICLEPQDFPDAPNKPQYPSTVLRPDEEYRHHTVIEFRAT